MTNEPDFQDLVDQMMGGKRRRQSVQTPPTSQEITARVQRLIDARTALFTPAQLQPGDLVTYKPGMKNKNILDGYPGIVIRLLDTPVTDDAMDSTSPYYREPLDIVIGTLEVAQDGQPTFIEVYLDSRRLDVYIPETNFGRGN